MKMEITKREKTKKKTTPIRQQTAAMHWVNIQQFPLIFMALWIGLKIASFQCIRSPQSGTFYSVFWVYEVLAEILKARELESKLQLFI